MATDAPKPVAEKTTQPIENSERASALILSQNDHFIPLEPQQPKTNPVQGGIIDFEKTANPYDKSKATSPEAPLDQLTNDLAGARLRAMLGLEQSAPDFQVTALAKGFTRAGMVADLGLDANATPDQIDAAIEAKMRDNVGLPADATDDEYKSTLLAYNELAMTSGDTAAHDRAELALPPSATEEEVAQAGTRIIESMHKAVLGLPQSATEAQVVEAFLNYTPGSEKETLGLSPDATGEVVGAALEAKMRENVGLPATATTTQLSRRLAEYEKLAETDPVGAQMRADLGLAPSATVVEMAMEAYEKLKELSSR